MKPPIVFICFWLCLTVARSQIAVPAWNQHYDGPQNSTDQATAIAVDGAGNVFVTGQSIGSTNFFDYDYATIQYSGGGVPLWTNRYNGPAVPAQSWESANAIAVDTNGDVFVTGYSYGGSSGYDYATVKYSSAGLPLWTNRYNGPGNGDDYAKGIAVDAGGNVIVTGYSTGSGSSFDYATIKYSSAGTPLWTNRYDGPGNGYDRANAITVGTNDSVIVTGYSFSSGNGFDYATIEYSSAGLPLWTNRYNGPGNGEDRAMAIAADANGNVFVTGSSTNGSDFDYATIKYSDTGVPIWTNRYDGSGNGHDQATGVAGGGNGNVFVTGASLRGHSIYGDLYDYATVAYSGAGMPLWTNRYVGIGDDNEANAIAVDRHGNVFVTGQSIAVPSVQYSYVCATIAYTGAGAPLWTNRNTAKSFGQAIAVDSDDNVFVSGFLVVLNSDHDYMTIKYSVIKPPLNFQWLGNQLVLSWTNADFGLQSAPDLAGTFTNILGASSPYTNLPTARQQFFRLISN